MGVIQGGQAALQSRSLEKIQLVLLLADEMGEGGEQLYTGNSSLFSHRDTLNDSALVLLGRLKPLALLRWDSPGC